MVVCNPLPLTEYPGLKSTYQFTKKLLILLAAEMSTAFLNVSFENKHFINEQTFTSSTFGITGDVSRNS